MAQRRYIVYIVYILKFNQGGNLQFGRYGEKIKQRCILEMGSFGVPGMDVQK